MDTIDDLFRVVKGIATNIDPSGLIKTADGIATVASGVAKLVDGESDALDYIAKGGSKVISGTGIFLGFIKSDSGSDFTE